LPPKKAQTRKQSLVLLRDWGQEHKRKV
jgi:hypothetical protein